MLIIGIRYVLYLGFIVNVTFYRSTTFLFLYPAVAHVHGHVGIDAGVVLHSHECHQHQQHALPDPGIAGYGS